MDWNAYNIMNGLRLNDVMCVREREASFFTATAAAAAALLSLRYQLWAESGGGDGDGNNKARRIT